MKSIIKINSILILIILINSCASKKKYVYFNETINQEKNLQNFNPTLKTGDILNIIVFSSAPENAVPFNLPIINTNIRAGYTNGIASNPGYLINNNGTIDFPIIGEISLINLTTTEASNLIKSKLLNYISEPIVNIHIDNFKITILGEVRNPGTFQIPNERITILEALGLAGDLTINGIRKEILLIRDENGQKKEIKIDLTNNSILNSEYYYLTQNDVIYVKPNQAKINSSVVSSSYGMFISIASLLITTINVLTK